MSDDQPTRDESAVPFSERVTIDTLADRPSIPSFDTRSEEWKAETVLRLEGKLTDQPGNPIHDIEGMDPSYKESVVIVIGPEDKEGHRGVALYWQRNGQKEASLDGYELMGKLGREDTKHIIKEDDNIRIPLGKYEGQVSEINPTLEIESIKSGPLT